MYIAREKKLRLATAHVKNANAMELVVFFFVSLLQLFFASILFVVLYSNEFICSAKGSRARLIALRAVCKALNARDNNVFQSSSHPNSSPCHRPFFILVSEET